MSGGNGADGGRLKATKAQNRPGKEMPSGEAGVAVARRCDVSGGAMRFSSCGDAVAGAQGDAAREADEIGQVRRGFSDPPAWGRRAVWRKLCSTRCSGETGRPSYFILIAGSSARWWSCAAHVVISGSSLVPAALPLRPQACPPFFWVQGESLCPFSAGGRRRENMNNSEGAGPSWVRTCRE